MKGSFTTRNVIRTQVIFCAGIDLTDLIFSRGCYKTPNSKRVIRKFTFIWQFRLIVAYRKTGRSLLIANFDLGNKNRCRDNESSTLFWAAVYDTVVNHSVNYNQDVDSILGKGETVIL